MLGEVVLARESSPGHPMPELVIKTFSLITALNRAINLRPQIGMRSIIVTLQFPILCELSLTVISRADVNIDMSTGSKVPLFLRIVVSILESRIVATKMEWSVCV